MAGIKIQLTNTCKVYSVLYNNKQYEVTTNLTWENVDFYEIKTIPDEKTPDYDIAKAIEELMRKTMDENE